MKKLYFVFDQLPPSTAGGLINTYIRLFALFKDDFDIQIISVFNYPDEANNTFQTKKHILMKRKIDIRFFKKLTLLKKGHFIDFSKGLFDTFYFFGSIPFARRKMKKIISEDDYVIVSSPAAGIFMSKKNKFILEIHSKFENFWEGGLKSKLQVKLMNPPKIILFRTKADANKGSQYYLSDYIYNFFDNSEICIKKDILDYKKRALYVGRLHPDKDPMRLLEICFLLKQTEPDFLLDIYGEGELLFEMEKYIHEKNLEKNVRLLGFVDDKNIYQNYSMLWLTSKTEGFPLTVIEAKANAIPTISTKWGDGVCEAIELGEDGYYVDSNEEFVAIVKTLFNDSMQLKKLSNRALHGYEPFSKKQAKIKWLSILESYKNK